MKNLKKITGTSGTVRFKCEDCIVHGESEFCVNPKNPKGGIAGFIVYTNTLKFENVRPLTPMDKLPLKLLYKEYYSPGLVIIDWD